MEIKIVKEEGLNEDHIKTGLKCYTWGLIKPEQEFYKSKKNLSGREGSCKECCKKKAMLYRNNPFIAEKNKKYMKKYSKHNKEKLSKIQKKYRLKNQLKSRARSKVNHAIRDRRLFKPNCCEYCCLEDVLYAHHTSYDEHMWLNVIWLCRDCHLKADKDLI